MRIPTRLLLSAAAVLLAAALAALTAEGAVLKNKKTGETIRGTLQSQKINGKNVFSLNDGGTVFIDLADWEAVEGDGAAPAAPSAAPGAAPVGASAGALAARKAYVFPITGAIENHAQVEALERGLEEAKRQNVAIVILRMDTPGGRIDLADQIIQALGKVDSAPVVSFIEGGSRRALSAGAYICLATQKIFMAPGTTIGAATPFRQSVRTGAPQIDAKLTSAFRARFHSLAQARGYPTALVDAMVDFNVSVVQVFVNDKPMLVTADEAGRLESAHKADGLFKRGKVVNKPGELITLTSDEAAGFGVCAAVVSNAQDLLIRMRLGGCEVVNAAWVPAWIERLAKERTATVTALVNSFKTEMVKARAFYDVAAVSPTPADALNNINQCMNRIKEGRRILSQLEKLAADERYDVDAPPGLIAERKSELDGILTRLDVLRKKL